MLFRSYNEFGLGLKARDEGTGVRNHITITKDGRWLSKQEVERMVRDVEGFRREKEEQKAKKIAKADLDDYVYNMRSKAQEVKTQGNITP